MDKVKWGVLGTANIAKGQTIPGMQRAGNCELYAIAGRSMEKASQFKDEFGFKKAYGSYEELLQDPDVQAVYIPLPNNLHLKWVKEALESGKHVLCEKPLGLDPDEVKDMFDTAKKNGVNLMEAFAYLHSPYVASLKKDVDDKVIGDVDYIISMQSVLNINCLRIGCSSYESEVSSIFLLITLFVTFSSQSFDITNINLTSSDS